MNRPTLYQLECFTAVAEELSFTRAARRLNLSQPPLSRQILALESQVGTGLLERSTRSVALTAAGALFLEDVRDILKRLDSAVGAARRAATGEITRLRLAFVGALLDENLGRVLQKFRQQHPRCQVHVLDLSPAAQLEAMRAGQVDGAFVGARPEKLDRNFSSILWKRDPLLVVLPEAHPLARKRLIALRDLKSEDWVMVSRAAAPAFRMLFDRLCVASAMRARVVQESDRAAAVLTMVAAGQGASLFPSSISRLPHAGVQFRPIKGSQPTLEHCFAYRASILNPALSDFIRLLRRFSGNL